MQKSVVFLHEGNQSYLRIAIDSARTVGLSPVLLGDLSNKEFCDNWYSMSSFVSDKYEEFKSLYKHYSTNSEEFELRCFKRYFTLLEFMKKNNLKDTIMVDSDVVFLMNLDMFDFEEYDVALSIHERQNNYRWSICPHCSYWKYEALSEFVDYLLLVYKKDISLLEEKWHYHTANRVKGGVCDMTLLYLWSERTNKKIMNIAKVNNGCVIDNAISSSENFVDNEYAYSRPFKMKKLILVEETFCFVPRTGNAVKVVLIHCQGGAKNLMESFYKRDLFMVKVLRIKYYIERVLSYAKKSWEN